MTCPVCLTSTVNLAPPSLCNVCITERIEQQVATIDDLQQQRHQLQQQLTALLHQTLVPQQQLQTKVIAAATRVRTLRHTIDTDGDGVRRLRAHRVTVQSQLQQRQQELKQHRQRLEAERQQLQASRTQQPEPSSSSHRSVQQKLAVDRRQRVEALLQLYPIKRKDAYACTINGLTLPDDTERLLAAASVQSRYQSAAGPAASQWPAVSSRTISTCLGWIAFFTSVLAQYTAVRLPYDIRYAGSNTCIIDSVNNQSRRYLLSTDDAAVQNFYAASIPTHSQRAQQQHADSLHQHVSTHSVINASHNFRRALHLLASNIHSLCVAHNVAHEVTNTLHLLPNVLLVIQAVQLDLRSRVDSSTPIGTAVTPPNLSPSLPPSVPPPSLSASAVASAPIFNLATAALGMASPLSRYVPTLLSKQSNVVLLSSASQLTVPPELADVSVHSVPPTMHHHATATISQQAGYHRGSISGDDRDGTSLHAATANDYDSAQVYEDQAHVQYSSEVANSNAAHDQLLNAIHSLGSS